MRKMSTGGIFSHFNTMGAAISYHLNVLKYP